VPTTKKRDTENRKPCGRERGKDKPQRKKPEEEVGAESKESKEKKRKGKRKGN
jgi:hypothetical protein